MSKRTRVLTIITSTALIWLLGTALASAEPGKKPGAPHGRHDHHGGLFARLDANQDGKIDRGESRTAASELFARMDKNGDGSISKDEKLEPPARHGGPKQGDHFTRMDKNGDGKIARSETRMPKERFDRADANKDGSLTRAELDAAWKARAAKHRDERFAELDTNKNGKVEKAEALAHADRFFVELDANKDGQVTRDEARASMAAKRHGKGRGAHGCGEDDKPAKTSAKGQAI